MHDCFHVQLLQVGIFLAHAHIQDWLSCAIDQGQSGSDLVINSVELREQYSADLSLIGISGLLLNGLVKFGDLIHGVVSNQSLSDKND